jgi:hypothetical protein
MPQRLDDRIKELCAKAITTPPSPQLDEILTELKSSLHEHTERMRKAAANYRARHERRSKDE